MPEIWLPKNRNLLFISHKDNDGIAQALKQQYCNQKYADKGGGKIEHEPGVDFLLFLILAAHL